MGAVPSLAWIIPDDENIQSVFGQPRDQFQELFKTTQEKLESKLDTFVEDLQKSVHAHQEYVQAEIDAAFDEYFEPEGPQVNENLEFFDTEAWVEHAQFEMSDLDEEPEIEYSFSVTRHKHKGHKDHKHHKGKHHYKEHDHEGHDDDDPADGTDP